MKTFLQYIGYIIFVYLPLIIIFSSVLLLFINNKKYFLEFTIFILNSIFVIIITLSISMMLYPTGDSRVGYTVEILFLLIPSIIFIVLFTLKVYLNYIKYPHHDRYTFYIKQKFKYITNSFLVTGITIFLMFQFFLIWSAFNAYEKARELSYIGIGYSITSFYSPFIKPIVFKNKRYSYHRAKYVDLNE